MNDYWPTRKPIAASSIEHVATGGRPCFICGAPGMCPHREHELVMARLTAYRRQQRRILELAETFTEKVA